MSTPDDIAELIAEARENIPRSLGDWANLASSLTTALEATLPRTVSTVAELDELPVGTILRGRDSEPMLIDDEQTDGLGLRYIGLDRDCYYTGKAALQNHGPFTVLHIGGEK